MQGDKVEQVLDGKQVQLAEVLAIFVSEVAQLKGQLAVAMKEKIGEVVKDGFDNPVGEQAQYEAKDGLVDATVAVCNALQDQRPQD